MVWRGLWVRRSVIAQTNERTWDSVGDLRLIAFGNDSVFVNVQRDANVHQRPSSLSDIGGQSSTVSSPVVRCHDGVCVCPSAREPRNPPSQLGSDLGYSTCDILCDYD